MITICGRNVNYNYQASVDTIREIGEEQESRAGRVLAAPHPVMTVTTRPMERVLFDEDRDANPFFHFFECLWMLTGSNDGRWLDTFVRNFSERFAESNGVIHGAYGHRWRNWAGEALWCQLGTVIDILRHNPLDRRVVISMWDPQRDLAENTRDVPCNTHMYPRIVTVGGVSRLDLTICCRSNDIIWGATGANAVHFSFVQEYLAAQIGVSVGTMYQLSNNWHAYEDVLGKIGQPDSTDPYTLGLVEPHPICQSPEDWDDDLMDFMDNPTTRRVFKNRFFRDVAQPMWNTHLMYRSGNVSGAIEYAEREIAASDWRLAAIGWLTRRAQK